MTKAVIIAGTQSGSGKTTVTLGLMAALARTGLTVQPFKCGPDFIDPSLHKLVTGKTSRNLDMWMAGDVFTRQTFTRHGNNADISVIEGVMGMYDGGDSSSAALGEQLGVPVVLVLDVRSAAESAAAVLKGFETLNPEVKLRGVILNRIASPRHLQLVTDAIQEHCKAEILGYLPRNVAFTIPERHLGLYMGEEDPITSEAISELAETITEHVNLDRLLEIAQVPERHAAEHAAESISSKIRLAVAQDKAFCFYYQDNLDLLRQAGAELVFFSPLADTNLPENIDGIYFGGGYPELYAEQLSANKEMLAAVKDWADTDGHIYGECGGFMYLTEGIVDHDGQFHPMSGLFPVQAQMKRRRASLGYREIRLKEDGLFGAAGTVLRGHEFHYSSIDELGSSIKKIYAVNNGTEEGYCYKNVLGGYLHLHFGFNPNAVTAMIHTMQNSGKI